MAHAGSSPAPGTIFPSEAFHCRLVTHAEPRTDAVLASWAIRLNPKERGGPSGRGPAPLTNSPSRQLNRRALTVAPTSSSTARACPARHPQGALLAPEVPLPRQGEAARAGYIYPVTALKKARQKRADARELLQDRIDPSAKRWAEKEARADAQAFETVAREWLVKQQRVLCGGQLISDTAIGGSAAVCRS